MANNPIHCPSAAAPTDRRLIERNRRNEMNSLFSTLNSLLPAAHDQTSKEETKTVPDQVENATNYIKELQRKVEKLKEKKEKLMEMRSGKIGKKPKSLMVVQVEVHHQVGSSMELLLTTGSDYHFVFAQIVRLLQQNGAQVISVNQSMFSDRVFHKILAEVIGEEMGPGSTEIGERICEKVKKFVSEYKDEQ